MASVAPALKHRFRRPGVAALEPRSRFTGATLDIDLHSQRAAFGGHPQWRVLHLAHRARARCACPPCRARAAVVNYNAFAEPRQLRGAFTTTAPGTRRDNNVFIARCWCGRTRHRRDRNLGMASLFAAQSARDFHRAPTAHACRRAFRGDSFAARTHRRGYPASAGDCRVDALAGGCV